MPIWMPSIGNDSTDRHLLDYKERHDSVGKILKEELAKKLKLIQEDQLPYYKYTPDPVHENNDFKLYWNCSLETQ